MPAAAVFRHLPPPHFSDYQLVTSFCTKHCLCSQFFLNARNAKLNRKVRKGMERDSSLRSAALPMTTLCNILIFNHNTKTQSYSLIPKLWERPLSPSNFEGVPEGRGSLHINYEFSITNRSHVSGKLSEANYELNFLYKLPRPAVRLGNPLIKAKRNLANRRPPLQNLKGIWGTPPSQKLGMADENWLPSHCFLFKMFFYRQFGMTTSPKKKKEAQAK